MMINNVLRSVQKTSGLFDTEFGKQTDNAEKKTLFDEVDFLENVDLAMVTPAAVGGQGFGGLDIWGTGFGGTHMLLDEDSMDQFMDLSQFLEQESTPLGLDTIVVNHEDAVIKHAQKSKCVLGDHDYVIKMPCMVSLPVKEEHPSVLSDDLVQPRLPKDKYRERRRKNNIASRRSRETRKQKFLTMETESDVLERQNVHLEKKIIEMEALAKEMKAALVTKLVARK